MMQRSRSKVAGSVSEGDFDDHMTVEEASEILGLAAKTIYNRKGGTAHLLRIRQGRTVRLLRAQVMEHKQNLLDEARRRHEMIYGS
jgi:hypothetical protein